MPFIYARIVLVAVLVAYSFVPSLRLYATQVLLGFGGIIMLSLGMASVASPTLLGQTNTYILLGDSLTLIEAGILAIVLSAELSAQRSRFMARGFAYIQLLVAFRPKKLLHSPHFLQPTKILKAQFQSKSALKRNIDFLDLRATP